MVQATKTISTVDLVRQTLKASNKPLKARLIARNIRQKPPYAGFKLLRKDVNSILYNELEHEVQKNDSFEWKLV